MSLSFGGYAATGGPIVGVVVGPQCHLCDEPLASAPVVGTVARGGKPSRRVACVRCGLVQVSPQPSSEDLDAYYRGDYHREHGPVALRVDHADGTAEIVAPDDPRYADAIATMHRTRADAVVRDLDLVQGAKVLEVGCAAGLTLAELQRLGMDVYGVEPDPEMADAARARTGCRIRTGDLDSFATHPDAFAGTRYDAVIAFHVLEHFPDPLSALVKMLSLLRPGGHVWLEVPNTARPGLPLTEHWQWVHLYDFSAHTLAALLYRAGFDDIEIDDRGPLRAWARKLSSNERPYEPHNGPDGAQVAQALARLEGGEPERPIARGAVERLMAGESLDADATPALREELTVMRDGVNRMAEAYRTAADLLGELSEQLRAQAMQRLEDWHEDDYHHGFVQGEGFASQRHARMIADVANAMRLVEAMDGDGEEERNG